MHDEVCDMNYGPTLQAEIKLAVFLEDRYLFGQDAQFVDLVTEDLERFLEVGDETRVLVFPAVNNFHRFLIHKTVDDFSSLASFSVGQGEERRTVVCFLSIRYGAKPSCTDPSTHHHRARNKGCMCTLNLGHNPPYVCFLSVRFLGGYVCYVFSEGVASTHVTLTSLARLRMV
ncbi:Coiled-coil domain-containing protein r3hcc1l [Branchiostoma belcheri]|nr:Coiled-coil domain-containing protein r3hcc1l [Branchiostoma belcheri]